MAHELIIDWPSKKQREKRNVSLVAYGEAGRGKSGLAMSRTVGIPAAIAAKMILDGEQSILAYWLVKWLSLMLVKQEIKQIKLYVPPICRERHEHKLKSLDIAFYSV